jgi:catechol 2,3-dioxygenase-like lactoylglutathione lyase family enzyme
MLFDHINLRCTDLDATRSFLETVAGLTTGERPPFPFPGYWLYHDGHAIVHLVGARDPLAPVGALGHIAFRFDDLRPQIERLSAAGFVCDPEQVPDTDIYQFFMSGPDGVTIEFQGRISAGA